MVARKHAQKDEQDDAETPDSLLEQAQPETLKSESSKTESDTKAETSPEAQSETPPVIPGAKQHWLKRCWHGYTHHKKWTIPVSIVVAIGTLLAVPATRYPILALGVSQSYTITVADRSTHAPITGATITLDGKHATTNNKGTATIRSHVGSQTITVSKRYYKPTSAQVFVGVRKVHNAQTVHTVATGRQVPIVVINAINKKPVENASVSATGTTVKTDSNGKATIVLPTSATTQSASITASGYNQASAKIEVTSTVVSANTFAITPSGKAYFLSNANGTIDVVSANLDGTDRKVLISGTGKEIASSTQLFQTDDAQFLALQSRRDGGEYDKLFLIDAATGKLTTIDEGDASFSVTGWSGHHLIYSVTRTKVDYSQPKRYAIKSYNADAKKIVLLGENGAESNAYGTYTTQDFTSPYIVDNTVVYGASWSGTSALLAGKTAQVIRINNDGSGKKVLKEVSEQPNQNTNISVRPLKPQDIYIIVEQYTYYPTAHQTTYIHYANGNTSVATESAAQVDLNKPYIAYYGSPSGNQTFWSESRDGKSSLFVGDKNGSNGKQIAGQSEYAPRGWASDAYVLVTKKGNELYVMSASGGEALKISDYFATSNGYGY